MRDKLIHENILSADPTSGQPRNLDDLESGAFQRGASGRQVEAESDGLRRRLVQLADPQRHLDNLGTVGTLVGDRDDLANEVQLMHGRNHPAAQSLRPLPGQ